MRLSSPFPQESSHDTAEATHRLQHFLRLRRRGRHACHHAVLAQQKRADLWKQVAEADRKGLPRTGIKALEPIIDGAIKDKNYPEAIKAIAKKIILEGNIEGNKPEEKITRMQAAISAAAPAEMQPVMNAILAHWYWHYFQQNRWRFTQRTATGVSPGERHPDLGPTANLRRDRQDLRRPRLTAEQELKTTPVANYDDPAR